MKPDQIITCDKELLGGTPVFKGTRVPLQSLIDHLKAGDSLEDFLDGFPSVSREQACVFLELAQESLLRSCLKTKYGPSPFLTGTGVAYNERRE